MARSTHHMIWNENKMKCSLNLNRDGKVVGKWIPDFNTTRSIQRYKHPLALKRYIISSATVYFIFFLFHDIVIKQSTMYCKWFSYATFFTYVITSSWIVLFIYPFSVFVLRKRGHLEYFLGTREWIANDVSKQIETEQQQSLIKHKTHAVLYVLPSSSHA